MTKRHVEAERSGPESGDFGPLLQCRSVSDPHVAMLLRMTGRSQKGDVGI